MNYDDGKLRCDIEIIREAIIVERDRRRAEWKVEVWRVIIVVLLTLAALNRWGLHRKIDALYELHQTTFETEVFDDD